MAAPLILGGIEVPLHAGAPEGRYARVGGYTDTRRGLGKPVRARHFSKWVITISGSGWMATGLDVLDWDQYHTLLCPKPMRVATTGTEVSITTDARPDVAAVCHALVGREWVQTPVSLSGRDATITPVAGSAQYSLAWYPAFTVLCTPPEEANTGGSVAWQITANEA
jgi:hypothetical protein